MDEAKLKHLLPHVNYMLRGERCETQPFLDLRDKHLGASIDIVGCGPSAANYEPTGNPAILCNAAILHHPGDYGLVVEGMAYSADWFPKLVGKMDIQMVWALVLSGFVNDPTFDSCPKDFWRNVIWTSRQAYSHSEQGLRNMGRGLVFSEKDMSGSITMAAIGLAAGMGASEVHTYGTEFYFPDGQQHEDGSAPYKPWGEQVRKHGHAPVEALVKFDWQNRTAYIKDNGEFESTTYFIQSAAAIRTVMKRNPDITLVDHSGGLLSW